MNNISATDIDKICKVLLERCQSNLDRDFYTIDSKFYHDEDGSLIVKMSDTFFKFRVYYFDKECKQTKTIKISDDERLFGIIIPVSNSTALEALFKYAKDYDLYISKRKIMILSKNETPESLLVEYDLNHP